jgi:hypothetical protein
VNQDDWNVAAKAGDFGIDVAMVEEIPLWEAITEVLHHVSETRVAV